jgi:hypothetical protein
MTSNEKMKEWIKHGTVLYFPHFLSIWTSIQAWFNQEYPDLQNDRDKIDEFKTHPHFILIRVFESIGNEKPIALEKIEQMEKDTKTKGYIQYSNENVLIRLYKFAFSNPTMHLQLNNMLDDQSIHSLYLPLTDYTSFHEKIDELKTSDHDKKFPLSSLQHYLEPYGIASKGGIFYNDPKKENLVSKPFPSAELSLLVTTHFNFDLGPDPKGLFADTIEILHQIHNACVHGSFEDPANIENNDLFQAAYEFLFRLLTYYLGDTPGNLHF